MPANQTLAIVQGVPATSAYQVIGTFQDGHTEDVTAQATLSLADTGLGAFEQADFKSTTDHGGVTMVNDGTFLTPETSFQLDDGILGGVGTIDTSVDNGICRPVVTRLPPVRLSRTTRKSSMLMWVNCGLPATSPIAQTPGAVV